MTDSAKPTEIGWSYNKCPADETYTIWLTDSEGECLPQGWVFDEKDAKSICRAMNRDHLFERATKLLKYFISDTKDDDEGWWCPVCKAWKSWERVTHTEHCNDCGTFLSDVQPDKSICEEIATLLDDIKDVKSE